MPSALSHAFVFQNVSHRCQSDIHGQNAAGWGRPDTVHFVTA